jgi:hypothetical protein
MISGERLIVLVTAGISTGFVGPYGSADRALVSLFDQDPTLEELEAAREYVLRMHQGNIDARAGSDTGEESAKWWAGLDPSSAGRRQQMLDVIARAENVLRDWHRFGKLQA